MRTSPFSEFLAMPLEELRREIKSKRATVAKMRLQVEMKKEKNTGKLRTERRQLASLLTALSRKEQEAPKEAKKSLPPQPRSPKVPVSK